MSPRVNHRLEAERARLAELDQRARLEAADRRSAHLQPVRKPKRGRPRALTPRQVAWVRALVPVHGEGTIAKAAVKLGVSDSTLHAIRKSAQPPSIDPERLAAAERRVGRRKVSSPAPE